MIRRLPLRAAVLAAVVLTGHAADAQTRQPQTKPAPRNPPASAPAPAPPASPASVQVNASVDRTAIWVGDRVTYAIDIVCARGVEILLDDLAKEKLRLNGLDVVSSDSTTTTDASERTTYRLRYGLSTYRVDVPAGRPGVGGVGLSSRTTSTADGAGAAAPEPTSSRSRAVPSGWGRAAPG